MKKETYLKQVTIGKVQEVNGSITLCPYSKKWPLLYEQERLKILHALKGQKIAVEHVGSTSVPGLSAKPIIDLILFVEDPGNEKVYVGPLEKAGYTLRIREVDWYEHRMFKGSDPDVNLHVFRFGCSEALAMIHFRDLLRANPDEALYYEQCKQALATKTWHYVQDYADAKTAVIHEIMARHPNNR
jgi:GrpB-like predicted nucleotidyltransferase (UPF0157 family)